MFEKIIQVVVLEATCTSCIIVLVLLSPLTTVWIDSESVREIKCAGRDLFCQFDLIIKNKTLIRGLAASAQGSGDTVFFGVLSHFKAVTVLHHYWL